MKAARLLLFFLLALIITTAALSFMMATNQKVERFIVINAPADVIYDQIIKLENFHTFSVWSQQDSSAVYQFSGQDGTVGSSTSWKGSPEISGEGTIKIIALEPNIKIVHQLNFKSPKKGTAESIFTLNETEKSVTTVKWVFKLATPRPWNIFNLMFSLDKKMGKDFEDGLKNMKLFIELNNPIKSIPDNSE